MGRPRLDGQSLDEQKDRLSGNLQLSPYTTNILTHLNEGA